jgi:hypothetical protein
MAKKKNHHKEDVGMTYTCYLAPRILEVKNSILHQVSEFPTGASITLFTAYNTTLRTKLIYGMRYMSG